MTTEIHHFPEWASRRAIVETARTILRGAANHDEATLTEACGALKDCGDWMDHLEADAMLLALRLRASQRRIARPRPAIRADDVALAVSALFAVGMIVLVICRSWGW